MSDLPTILAADFGDIANLLVIILIGIVAGLQALFRWIVNRSKQQQQQQSGEPSPEAKNPMQTIGDQISREVRKYIGEIKSETAPTAETPPAPTLAPRPVPPPPPVVKAPEPMPALAELDTIPLPRKKPRRIRRARAVRTVTPPALLADLRTREGLRKAILSREILGPPVSLRKGPRSASRLTRR